jgi:hypothetical protein
MEMRLSTRECAVFAFGGGILSPEIAILKLILKWEGFSSPQEKLSYALERLSNAQEKISNALESFSDALEGLSGALLKPSGGLVSLTFVMERLSSASENPPGVISSVGAGLPKPALRDPFLPASARYWFGAPNTPRCER